jgi:predicted DNA-binding transcriptional regulator YafY
MNAKLMEAVKNKRIIMFKYKGKERIVEPHAYGTGHNHQDVLKGYQTAGKSDEEVPGWNTFMVTEIQELKLTKTNFENPRPDYAKGDKTFHTVFCEL